MPAIDALQKVLRLLEQRIDVLRSLGNWSETQTQQVQALLAALRPHIRPASPEEAAHARAWIQRRWGYQRIFGVGGSFWETFLLLYTQTAPHLKEVWETLGEVLADYFKEGGSLAGLMEAVKLGCTWYYWWDNEARKRWNQPLEALITSAAALDEAALFRLVVIDPCLAIVVPSVGDYLWKNLLSRKGQFFIRLGKALKEGVADRRQRRAVGELDTLLLFGMSFFKHTPLTDRELLARLQESGIAPRSMSESTFKVRRQRLGVRLSPKGRRGTTLPRVRQGKPSRRRLR